MRVISVADFHAELKAQVAIFPDDLRARGIGSRLDFAFVCPMCGTVQSARDLIAAGAGKDFDAVEGFLAFSCVGRWTDAGGPRRRPDGQPCNWTLGGLFPLHRLEVKLPDGSRHPRFEPANPQQALNHARALMAGGVIR